MAKLLEYRICGGAPFSASLTESLLGQRVLLAISVAPKTTREVAREVSAEAAYVEDWLGTIA